MAEAKEELLDMLNSYGQQFMTSFDASIFTSKRKHDPEASSSSFKKPKLEDESYADEEEAEEWTGFAESDSSEHEDESECETENAEKIKQPAVVIFSESRLSSSTPQNGSKAQLKSFMSSKVSKVTQELLPSSSRQSNTEEEEDDLTNAQNDALLHKLVHTKILSGSLDPDLEMTPAQRRKALAGRVLEAAGQAKLGKGETAVRAKERNKAAKHVRDGLLAKQKERSQKQLEEAKHMGNYHPALKQLFEDGTESKQKQKRERGLKMGVGTFSGGVLKLSRQEIASASGQSQKGSQRKGSKGKRR